MRLTVVGCGDAFGAGGRFNSCFLLQAGGRGMALDFGASTPVALKQRGLGGSDIDVVVVSHLHGDHFGGLPFLLLDSQYESLRRRPLQLIGPPGFEQRLAALTEIMFPGVWNTRWRYDLSITEMKPDGPPQQVSGFGLQSLTVVHPSGAPATGLRVSAGARRVAYSGDTEWTEALIALADGADLLILECMGRGKGRFGVVPSHLDLETIEANRERLNARRILLTHMGPGMLTPAAQDDARRRGYELAEDGLVLEL